MSRHDSEDNAALRGQAKAMVRPWLITTLLLLLALVICAVQYNREANNVRNRVLAESRASVELRARVFEHEIGRIIRNVHAVAEDPDLRAALSEDPQAGMDRLTEAAKRLSMHEPNFAQVRFIDADGQERVRVHPGPTFLPPDQLQNKAHRDYFKQAFALEPGAVYVSPLDPNMEHGKVELPLNPVMRVAAPVFNDRGDRVGVFVINYKGSDLLTLLEHHDSEDAISAWLMNPRGYWLQSSAAHQEWDTKIGNARDPDADATDIRPDLLKLLNSEPSGEASADDGGLWAWRSSDLADRTDDLPVEVRADGADVIVASHVPADKVARLLLNTRLAYGVVSLLLILAGTLLIRLFYSRQVNEDLERANSALQEKFAEQQLRDVFESSPVGMLIVGQDGRISRTNPEADRIFGYGDDELLGTPVDHLVPASARGQHHAHRAGYNSHPTTRRMSEVDDLRGLRKDGVEVPVDIALKPIRTEDGQAVLVTVVDVSTLRENQAMLEQSNRELEDKNYELEQFVYTVSHDLKSPLLTIEGFSGHLRSDIDQQKYDRVGSMCDRILEGAERMRRNIDDLLELSRIGRIAQPPRTIDTADMIAQILDELEARIEETDARITLEPDLPSMTCDPVRLHQCLLNLLSNALKYGHHPGEPPRIVIAGDSDNENDRLYVRDHGPGVPEPFAQKVFGLFQRLSNKSEGTGIGLAIVKRIAEIHGGRAWVEPTPGGGATFCLSLPKIPVAALVSDTARA